MPNKILLTISLNGNVITYLKGGCFRTKDTAVKGNQNSFWECMEVEYHGD